MHSRTKEFGEHCASKLTELFDEERLCENVEQGRAYVRASNGKCYDIEAIQRRFIQNVPFMSTRLLDAETVDRLRNTVRVDGADTADHGNDPLSSVQRVYEALKTHVPLSKNVDATTGYPIVERATSHTQARGCVIRATKVVSHANVTYYRSNVKCDNGKTRYFPPRFRIRVGQVAPGSSVRINTGYAFDMPTMTVARRIVDGVLQMDAKPTRQIGFVIVPIFMLDKGARANDIVPTLFARDAEDNGLMCLTFTTLSGNVGTLTVVLKAYKLCSPGSHVNMAYPEVVDVRVFKRKDFKNGRSVVNSKVGFYPETMCITRDRTGHGTMARFVCFDKMKRTRYDKQQLHIDNVITLLVSRKREWCDSGLVSTPGLFVPTKDNITADTYSIKPTVYASTRWLDTRSTNTHCLVFIQGRCILFDEAHVPIQDSSSYNAAATDRLEKTNKLINGAMHDLADYNDIAKSLRQMTRAVHDLRNGVNVCLRLARKHFAKSIATMCPRMLRVFDYHHVLSDGDARFDEYIRMSDRELFYSKLLSNSNALSVTLCRGMSMLVAKLFADELGNDEVRRLINSGPRNKFWTATIKDTTKRSECTSLKTQPINSTGDVSDDKRINHKRATDNDNPDSKKTRVA